MNKALGYLGLAARAGQVCVGAEDCAKQLRRRRGGLVIALGGLLLSPGRGLGLLLGSGGLRLGRIREYLRDTLHLVVLGQVLKDNAQLLVLKNLHMVLGSGSVLGQYLHNDLRGDAEILRHLMHSVFH